MKSDVQSLKTYKALSSRSDSSILTSLLTAYFYLHQEHLNSTGQDAFENHLLFQRGYETLYELVDPLAELLIVGQPFLYAPILKELSARLEQLTGKDSFEGVRTVLSDLKDRSASLASTPASGLQVFAGDILKQVDGLLYLFQSK